MSLHPKTEAQELRELLQGAAADRDAWKEKFTREHDAHVQTQQKLEEVTSHRDRLLGEKNTIWGPFVTGGDPEC